MSGSRSELPLASLPPMTVDNPRDRAVQRMFDRIAQRYDLLNRVISLRLDNRWRRQAIRQISVGGDPLILDLGSGTGDLTFAAAKALVGAGRGGRIIGLDFSPAMLERARQKTSAVPYGNRIDFVLGSALCSPFRGGVFDAVMTAFVLRNVSDLSLFFAEAYRALKPGGRFVSLEMFPPSKTWFSRLYAFYFYRLVPRIGGLLASDEGAYRYLSNSVRHFHSPEAVADIIRASGFEQVNVRRFFKGAVCMHTAHKLGSSAASG